MFRSSMRHLDLHKEMVGTALWQTTGERCRELRSLCTPIRAAAILMLWYYDADVPPKVGAVGASVLALSQARDFCDAGPDLRRSATLHKGGKNALVTPEDCGDP